MEDILFSIICCPRCAGDLECVATGVRCRSCGVKYDTVDGIPIFVDSVRSNWDIDLAKEKWHSFYDGFDWEAQRQEYDSANLPYIYKHLPPLEENSIFLEIGSGPSYLSYDLAGKRVKVICVDFDLEVLRKAKTCFERHGRVGIFICANIHRLPFKEGVIDCAAGIGVLEHSADLLQSVHEVHRILKPGGHTFQTLPCLSLLTLINASLRYGNVPHVPILGVLIRWLHIGLFKTRYMKYGYEESYSKGYLRRQFREGGFSVIDIGFYDHDQVILKKWSKLLSRMSYRLIRHRPFWDIVYVRASK